jgi:hypothetical protein
MNAPTFLIKKESFIKKQEEVMPEENKPEE